MKSIICAILDRSGSMGGRESDVINGVNGFIREQQALTDPACMAMVRFDSEAIERFRPMCELSKFAELTRADYQPRGGTPLLDAIGRTIAELETDWVREQPDRAIVVIVTDGYENSSSEYTKHRIKQLIEARQASGKWAFIYLGANVDAFAEAGSLGIVGANTGGYVSSAAGTSALYSTASASVRTMRESGATVAHNLGGNIGEDGTVTPATASKSTAKRQNAQRPAPSRASAIEPWTTPQAVAAWEPPRADHDAGSSAD